MLYSNFLVCIAAWFCVAVYALPTDQFKKYSETVDLDALYEPNPPVTHVVAMTIEYQEPLTAEIKRHNFNIDLYGTVVPLTVKNFSFLAKGVKARVQGQDPDKIHLVTYRETLFTKVVVDGFIRGGAVAPGFGTFSIHGGSWADENFDLKHDRPGRLTMANKGTPDSNDSEFMIVTKTEPATQFDNKHVVFGQISAGLKELLDIIQYVEKDTDGRPIKPFKIVWAVPDEYRLSDQETMQQNYLNDLAAFRAGDKSKGVTMAESLKPVKVYKTKEATKDIILSDSYSSNALRNILVIAATACACFGIYKYKDVILRKNSKIVSMR